MHTSLRPLVSQFLGVVAATLAPVILVAFVSLPLALGGHPGEARPGSPFAGQHMT